MTETLILALHDRQLAEHGGSPGIRDQGMLESALVRPQQWFACGGPELDIPALAAVYTYGLSRNHPFVDGNKRTAAVACELFLELNGFVLLAEDEDLYPVFMALAASEMDEEALIEWLRVRTRPESVNEAPGPYSRA